MKQLIMKDIRVLGLMNLIILIIAIGSGYMGTSISNIYKSNFIYGFAIVISIYLITARITTKEYKENSNTLIVSMPVKKFDVVKARYLFMIIYIIAISMIIYLSSNISRILFDDVSGNSLGLVEISIISSLIIIYLVFNIPFQYYNIGKAQIVNAIFYMMIILTPNILNRYDINILDISLVKKLLTLNLNQLSITLFGTSILLYFISLFVSKFIYEAKEF